MLEPWKMVEGWDHQAQSEAFKVYPTYPLNPFKPPSCLNTGTYIRLSATLVHYLILRLCVSIDLSPLPSILISISIKPHYQFPNSL